MTEVLTDPIPYYPTFQGYNTAVLLNGVVVASDPVDSSTFAPPGSVVGFDNGASGLSPQTVSFTNRSESIVTMRAVLADTMTVEGLGGPVTVYNGEQDYEFVGLNATGTQALLASNGDYRNSPLPRFIVVSLEAGGTPDAVVFDSNGVQATIGPNPNPPPPCFATGTLIATVRGAIAVENLRAGDIIRTLAGPAAVTWIGHRRARNIDVIRIRAGTLDATRDLIVSDDHALHVGDCLVPASLLVDGEGIVRERHEEVVLWHVELERHAILLAEGVAAESYLDTGNRQQFGNCPLAYDPIEATQDPCAEMVLAGSRFPAFDYHLAVVVRSQRPAQPSVSRDHVRGVWHSGNVG